MSLINAKNIYKSYADQVVLKGISLSLESGNIYVMKGRSGCGKSTLLSILSLLENPDSGEIEYNGTSVVSLSEKARKDILRNYIGFVFQDYNLFEEFTVYENLIVYLRTTTAETNAQMDLRINSVLDHLGLAHKHNTKAKLLSGGERQRVTLARVLLTSKKVIFADEPTANIDNANIQIMKDMFIQLKKDGAILLIATHDDVFDDIADCSVEIREGGLLCIH